MLPYFIWLNNAACASYSAEGYWGRGRLYCKEKHLHLVSKGFLIYAPEAFHLASVSTSSFSFHQRTCRFVFLVGFLNWQVRYKSSSVVWITCAKDHEKAFQSEGIYIFISKKIRVFRSIHFSITYLFQSGSECSCKGDLWWAPFASYCASSY